MTDADKAAELMRAVKNLWVVVVAPAATGADAIDRLVDGGLNGRPIGREAAAETAADVRSGGREAAAAVPPAPHRMTVYLRMDDATAEYTFEGPTPDAVVEMHRAAFPR